MKHKQKTLSRQVGKGIFLPGSKGAPSQSRRMVNKKRSQTGKGFFNDLWDSATTPYAGAISTI